MKKFLIVFSFCIFMKASFVYANNTYHGIDIDDIYNSSDWNSKEEIKNLVDDYVLLHQYENKLNTCNNNKLESCYDDIAQNIINHFCTYPENEIKEYNEFKENSLKFYTSIACTDKNIGVSGNLCYIDGLPYHRETMNLLIKNLIKNHKEKILFILPKLETKLKID